ncbi:MAG: SUF system Fe-S cluster assembly regulator [Limibacillus sp.]|jgi:FeS assembly SUF system regulator
MFRLNRLTDYAVVVMSQLALREEETLSAQQLARETAVPLPTVSKVLGLLAKDGLIVSQRGASGGYTLAQAPERITMAAIIQAIEGPIALTACVDGSEDSCASESLCPIRGTWDRVNQAIQGALDSVTLAEMAASFLTFPPAPAADAARRSGTTTGATAGTSTGES